MKIGEIIHNKYVVESLIAKGGMGTTYLAKDNSKEVVLKVLTLSEMNEWKTLELFEREAETLENINHPLIPDYIDYFTIENEKEIHYVIVQEYVNGKNLEVLVKEGRKFTLDEIKTIFQSLLKTLDYIHNMRSPIIHRDINPKNIILKKVDKVYLVDFGATGQVVKETILGGSTFVGTLGYTPQEQLYGKILPSTDLYALALTMIFLLTGREPSDFEYKDLKINYHPFVNIPDNMKHLLDSMINPDIDERIDSAKKALDILLEKSKIQQKKEKK